MFGQFPVPFMPYVWAVSYTIYAVCRGSFLYHSCQMFGQFPAPYVWAVSCTIHAICMGSFLYHSCHMYEQIPVPFMTHVRADSCTIHATCVSRFLYHSCHMHEQIPVQLMQQDFHAFVSIPGTPCVWTELHDLRITVTEL